MESIYHSLEIYGADDDGMEWKAFGCGVLSRTSTSGLDHLQIHGSNDGATNISIDGKDEGVHLGCYVILGIRSTSTTVLQISPSGEKRKKCTMAGQLEN